MSSKLLSVITALTICISLADWGRSSSSPPPAEGVDCTTLVLNLADCLSFVSAGSTVDKPEGTCCPGLKMVLKSHPECLCEAFRNSAQFGVTLNVSKAVSLPSACHVSAPSITNCGLSLVSGDAPVSAPIGAVSPSTTEGPTTSEARNIEAATPQLAPLNSESTALVLSIKALVFSFLAASLSI